MAHATEQVCHDADAPVKEPLDRDRSYEHNVVDLLGGRVPAPR